MLTKLEIDQLTSLHLDSKKIVISTHKGPDGDAIGSSTALYQVLKNQGHTVNVVIKDTPPKFLQWMLGVEEILTFDDHADKAEALVNEAEIIYSLDYNDYRRAGQIGEWIENSSAKKILIDHHEEPNIKADYNYHDAKSCSTAQLLYNYFEELDWKSQINNDVAASIYTGLLTDTGSFRFPSVDAKTHLIIADFIGNGFEHHKVHEAIFDGNSLDRMALNGYAVSSKLEVLPNQKVAVISLTMEEMLRFNAQKGDTEGLVNKALSIEGIEMAVFFKQAEDIIKISFRSKGDVFVNELARDNFSGGGHKYAAGGMWSTTIEEAIEKFKSIVSDYV